MVAHNLPMPISLPFFGVLFGMVLGMTFAVAMVSGSVWVVQLTLARGFRSGIAASAGMALAQFPTAFAASWLVLSFWRIYYDWDWALRLAAVLTLVFMAFCAFKSRPLNGLHFRGPLAEKGNVFMPSLGMAVTMPLRLPGYIALFIAVSMQVLLLRFEEARNFAGFGAFAVTLGVVLGAMVWYIYFAILAHIFGKRVPEPISLRSLNKLRILAGIIYMTLAGIALAPLTLALK